MFFLQTQLITSKGYPCEDYDVHTSDGYILGIQRIPGSRTEKENRKGLVSIGLPINGGGNIESSECEMHALIKPCNLSQNQIIIGCKIRNL